MKKAFIKFIIFFSSICALSENTYTDNYFFIISCIIMIGWSICSLFKSAIDYLSMEDVHSDYGYGNASYKNNTYRPYKDTSYRETVKKINKKLLPNTNTKIVKDNNNNKENNMTTSTEQHPTKVLSLLPIRDILRQGYNNPPTHSQFVSESTIIPIVGEKPIPKTEPIVEAEKAETQKTDGGETKEVVEKEPERMEVPIIIIQNESTMSSDRIAVYKSIIEAIKEKNMSQSMNYAILQSITAIDVYPESITIYTNKLLLFKDKTISEDDLIASMKKTLRADKLEIFIVERRDISISDYYLKNTFY